MTDQKNLILAIVISVAIMLGFQFFISGPRMEQQQKAEQTHKQKTGQPGAPSSGASVPGSESTVPAVPGSTPAREAHATMTRSAALAESARIRIDSPRIMGSIALTGGRVDDVSLSDYHVTISKDSANIVLLSPKGSPSPYYAEFGWTSTGGGKVNLPTGKTRWSANHDTLSPGNPVTLSWDNGEGLRFLRTYALDDNYMITVTQKVENSGSASVTLFPYALISRHGTPKTTGFYILHEGPYGVFNDKLSEFKYEDLVEQGTITEKSTGGWLGITDKYWLAALIPDQSQPFTGNFTHTAVGGDKYQVDYIRKEVVVAPGGAAEVKNRLFAGAKEVNLLDRYQDDLGIARFDLAIDWGLFYFLTRPLFFAIDYIYHLVGNFGLAILAVTFFIKVLFLPLAHKSYVSMSKMKKLQPEMVKLRERFGEDRQKLNQEMMALYKREKANPASGCLPMLLQIPVFFSLYKVLFVTIEMRHAPFYGWIHDLSAHDPTTLFNLFGLIPWTPPAFIPMIGVWPLLMGISMFLQQRLNPQPADPMQAKIFMFLPLFFTFLLASFPAGLVIYWTWNNMLSMGQQWLIMKRMGVKPGGGT